MTITLKPLHLVLIAFIAGLGIAGGAVLAFSGGDNDEPAVAQAATATPNVGADVAPTRAPATATPPPPPTATPPPPVVEAPQPIIRTCPEIRAAGDYLNPEERAFFLANCLTSNTAASNSGSSAPAAPSSAGPAAAPAQTGPTEEERAYRAKAEAQLADQHARLVQFLGTPISAGESAVLSMAGITGNLAAQLGTITPVPPRFLQAHDQLRAALSDYSQWLARIGEAITMNQTQAIAYLNGVNARANAVAKAWDDYILVVGLNVPSLR